MQPFTFKTNKALLPVGGIAAISRIIDKHPKNIEIVIAIGYEKEKIQQYIECAHSDRKIKFVEVKNITGKGSGPGFSLLCCKNYLQSPFVLTTIDTLVDEDCPEPYENWMGVADVDDSENYCTVVKSKIGDKIINLNDKIKCNTKDAFIGLAGIKDFSDFFTALESDSSETNGEVQVSNGFRGLFDLGITPKRFTWFDTGNHNGYRLANSFFSKDDSIFDFSKTDECLYFYKNNVIKYFADKETVANRVIRSKLLGDLCPKIETMNDYFYSYQKIPGEVFYDQVNPDITLALLNWLKSNLWLKEKLSKDEYINFQIACKDFYLKKTISRLESYYQKFNTLDTSSTINDINIPNTQELINLINFEWLSHGVPSNFHGDLQFDNILIDENNRFVLLDWRQEFSGITKYGDMYYDLAKLNGGMYVSYKNIKKGLFNIRSDGNKFLISFEKDKFLTDSKKIFNQFVESNSLDLKKIEVLTGLIFLNMAPMHHAPFSHYIYNLGRYQLNKWLNS